MSYVVGINEDFQIEKHFSEIRLQHEKHAFSVWYCLITVQLIALNAYLYTNHGLSLFNSFAIGGAFVNILWIIPYILDARRGIRIETRMIKLYTRFQKDEKLRSARSEYEASKRLYDSLFASQSHEKSPGEQTDNH